MSFFISWMRMPMFKCSKSAQMNEINDLTAFQRRAILFPFQGVKSPPTRSIGRYDFAGRTDETSRKEKSPPGAVGARLRGVQDARFALPPKTSSSVRVTSGCLSPVDQVQSTKTKRTPHPEGRVEMSRKGGCPQPSSTASMKRSSQRLWARFLPRLIPSGL